MSPVCRVAEASGFFERTFDGLEPPEDMDPVFDGAGGALIRTVDDLRTI